MGRHPGEGGGRQSRDPSPSPSPWQGEDLTQPLAPWTFLLVVNPEPQAWLRGLSRSGPISRLSPPLHLTRSRPYGHSALTLRYALRKSVGEVPASLRGTRERRKRRENEHRGCLRS